MEAIQEIEFDKLNLRSIKKIITLINDVRKIIILVGKLNKYLSFKVMGVSVLSILGVDGGGGMKRVIVKKALKILCVPIKAAIKKLTAGCFKAYKYDFPMNFKKPESGWLGLKFGFDKRSRKLDLFSCLPLQWAKNNLGNEYHQGAIKEYEPINRTQDKVDESGDEIKDQDEGQLDFGEIKQEEDVKDIKDVKEDNEVDYNQITEDSPKDSQENKIKEAENDVQNIVKQIQQSIQEIMKPDQQKSEIESQEDENCQQIQDERKIVLSIPLQKRKMGTGSVMNKRLLLAK